VKKIKAIIQKILGNKLIRLTLKNINLFVLGIASSNRVFSIIYHILAFHTFSREQHALLRARYKYYRNLNKSNKSRVELRRNIHRLEKGLLMMPQKETFALNYIEETVESYYSYAKQYKNDPDTVDIGELNWAHDVLSTYFNIVKKDKKITRINEKFDSIGYSPNQLEKEKENMLPYYRDINERSPVDFDSFLKLTLRRRSVIFLSFLTILK